MIISFGNMEGPSLHVGTYDGQDGFFPSCQSQIGQDHAPRHLTAKWGDSNRIRTVHDYVVSASVMMPWEHYHRYTERTLTLV